jgi:hypothetical protein
VQGLLNLNHIQIQTMGDFWKPTAEMGEQIF